MGSAVARKARTGELINRTYELEERLAGNPLCETYRAKDRKSSRAVRLKLLRPELALQAGAVEAFLGVPRALHGQSHPNLASVIAIDSDATGIPFVVEEVVEGEPLAATLERYPQGMPVAAALTMLTPLVDALAFMHARGVAHGQLDRAHVIVTIVAGQVVPKLLSGTERSTQPRATGPGDDAAESNLRADLRALGGLLRDVLLGEPTKPAGGDRTVVTRGPLSPALSGLVERCLGGEIASAEQVREALRAAREPRSSAPPRRSNRASAPSAPAPAPPVDLGLAQTVFAERQSVATTRKSRRPDTSAPMEFPTVETELAATAAPSGAPGPAQTASREPAPAPIEIKTLSDLAAAFAPMEGTERVGQAEFAPAPPESGRPSRPRPATAAATAVERRAPPPSRKQLREGVKPVPRALSQEQLRALRGRDQGNERRYSRVLSGLLFFLFVFLLAFAVPVLCDPTRGRAQELFGARAPLAMAGFAALAVVALIRTWALQIEARPLLLRPVTLSLKLVTAAVCVLASGYFLPVGALGPAARAAGWALPWGSGLFYLFLAMHGVVHNVREAGAQPVRALVTALLYSVALLGGHRVLSTTVLAKAAVVAESDTAEGSDDRAEEGSDDPSIAEQIDTVRAIANGEVPKNAAGAAAPAPMVQRKEAGASEADDMVSVDALRDSRKKRGSAFERLGADFKKKVAE